MRTSSFVLVICLLVSPITSPLVSAQSGPAAPSNLNASTGVVISTTKGTLIIRADDGTYQLFAMDRTTTRPETIPTRAHAQVSFAPSEDESAPVAHTVRIVAPAPAQTAALTGETAPPQDAPVPVSIRQMERDIERQIQRWRVGVRGGTTLDPELFLFGAHSQFGPFFSDRVWARPNLELGFGELTTLVALNFEGAYRIPVTQPRSRWNVYFGGGPGLNFAKQGLETEADDGTRVDFSDFDLDVGFNFFIGMQSRNGVFLELKSTAYSAPRVRFEVGYNF